MIQVLNGSWALFLGIFMLMVGNGLQGTLLGLRGEVEGFSTFAMSIIMSAYFGGFLISSRVVPKFIQRVGHVRVFAALGSMISAVLILYPALVEPWAWFLGRVVIGFCYCGVYITAESWLNDSSSNEDRGKALSLYMIIQMAGIVLAQYILLLGDISGYILFIIPSILVSLSFAPILLSVRPTPMTESAKPMSIRGLIDASPLACFGLFMLGGVFAAQFGMFAVYGSQQNLSVPQISLMISTLYVAAVVCQYPIGWLSDRMDRRILIMAAAALGGLACFLPILFDGFYWILTASFLTGATANPLYALLIAYANDYLDRDDMSSAAGGAFVRERCWRDHGAADPWVDARADRTERVLVVCCCADADHCGICGMAYDPADHTVHGCRTGALCPCCAVCVAGGCRSRTRGLY